MSSRTSGRPSTTTSATPAHSSRRSAPRLPRCWERRSRLEPSARPVVYDHAAHFAGLLDQPPVILEELVRQAIRDGGPALERAEEALGTLFKGIRNDLYAKHETDDREISALEAWNLRLGIAMEIEVAGFKSASRTFTLDGPTGKATRLYPLTLLEATARHDGEVEPGAWVEVRDLKAEWWIGRRDDQRCDRLTEQLPQRPLRLEVMTPGGPGPALRWLAPKLVDGTTFHVRGRVRSVRARTHRERLYAGLPELKDAQVADPFEALPRVLEDRRKGRLTALVHGDLNPRNVLLVADRPLLIDYAFTRDGEPFFFDFTRLEGCLARDVLPEDLSLAQHLRLQRLLAAACRSGERGADRFVQRLAAENPTLGAGLTVLALNLKRLSGDWQLAHGHPVWLVETFVDPRRFAGTCYRAAGWLEVGTTRGYGRRAGRYEAHGEPKTVWVRPLVAAAAQRLCTLGGEPMKVPARPLKLSQSKADELLRVLMSLPHRRHLRGRRHDQTSILAVAICAVLCGARSYVAIAEWAARCSQNLLKRLCCRRSALSRYYAPPSEPTIRRVLQSIDAEQVDRALASWLRGLCGGQSDAVAIDGKTLRGAHRVGGGQVHLLGAVLHGSGVTLGQCAVDEKSNEIPAAPALLGPMELHGLTVTADALHTQRELARLLVEEKGADYCFTVKDNQPTLKQGIATLFEPVSFPPSARNA